MKKIGFVDHYIDEWHANMYPGWIRESAQAGKFSVHMAWEECTPEGKVPIAEWCRKQNVVQAKSIRQLVDECDCIAVLSPDNSERHEELADIPLRSGKPVYIDKTFAPTLQIAKSLFAKAEKHSTPLMSSSALRFGSAFEKALAESAGQKVNYVMTMGSGRNFEIYAVHQLEMLVRAIGTGAKRVMASSNGSSHAMIFEYPDSRRAAFNFVPGQDFQITMQYGADRSICVGQMSDFFKLFIEKVLHFFDTGVSSVPKQETLEIMALIEAGSKALKTPGAWVNVPV